jgi:hypothetical protein
MKKWFMKTFLKRLATPLTKCKVTFQGVRKFNPPYHNPPAPLWNNPLPPFPLNKGGQRGLYKGEGDGGRGLSPSPKCENWRLRLPVPACRLLGRPKADRSSVKECENKVFALRYYPGGWVRNVGNKGVSL